VSTRRHFGQGGGAVIAHHPTFWCAADSFGNDLSRVAALMLVCLRRAPEAFRAVAILETAAPPALELVPPLDWLNTVDDRMPVRQLSIAGRALDVRRRRVRSRRRFRQEDSVRHLCVGSVVVPLF
jgi:pimeloyl-ACP methyl ester carboxylesterase